MINSATLPATLEAVASITGREIDLRTEVRADCPLCGKDDPQASKLRVSQEEHGGLFAWCYSCNAPSRTILRALGVNASGSSGRPVQREKDKPLPGLMAPEGSEPPPGPIAPVAMRMYMNAIRTPGRAYEVKYYSIDGRVGTHKRTALPPEPGRTKPGKRITMTGLKGHGWYPRKWVPSGGPVIGRPRCITEGEADAGLIAERGLEAYSTPGGAGRYRSLALNNVVNDALADGSPVIIIQDNDAPGYKWGDAITLALVAQGVSVYRPSPVQLPVGDSLADDPGRLREIVHAIETGGDGGGGVSYFATKKTPCQDLVTYCKYVAKYDTPQGAIPRMKRPSDRRCMAGYGRRGTAAADLGSGKGQKLTMPVACRKCDQCREWDLDERSMLWVAGDPVAGCQTIVRFFDLGTVDDVRKALHAQHRRKGGCEGQPAFHVTIPQEHPAVDDDSEPTYTYDIIIWYRDRLPVGAVANTREGARDLGIRCEVEEGATVTRADFAGAMTGVGMLRSETGRRKRRFGPWQWPVKWAPASAPVYTLGRDAHRVHVPGERGSVEPDGSEAAMRRLEIERRDRETGSALNAKDWMVGVVIPEPEWKRLVQDVQEGLRPPRLPGYHGPPGLLRDAVWAWLYVKPVRAAYLEVYARIGAAVGDVAELERGPLSDVARGLRQLERRLKASELAGGGVSLVEPPASDEIGVEDYDAWDDFDVAMPEWDDDDTGIEGEWRAV